MGGMSIWHWVIVGLIVMLLFGRGKISEMMGDVAKGIKAFKKGMSEDETVDHHDHADHDRRDRDGAHHRAPPDRSDDRNAGCRRPQGRLTAREVDAARWRAASVRWTRTGLKPCWT